MYDPIFAKSFSRHDRKRFGWFALLFSFLIALSILSTSNPTLHRPFSILGDAVRLQLSINALQDLLIDDDIPYTPSQSFENSDMDMEMVEQPQLRQKPALNLRPPENGDRNIPVINNTVVVKAEAELAPPPLLTPQENKIPVTAVMSEPPEHGARNIPVINNTVVVKAETELPPPPPQTPQENKIPVMSEAPPCRVGKNKADYCEMEGDVRVDSNSSTVFLIRPGAAAASWSILPYPRKGIASVKKWTVKLSADGGGAAIPKCTQTHPHPAILFSTSGFAGNHFHDFADILFPLFTTSFHFQRNVHFLAADYQRWWLSKYRPLLRQLTRHEILDAGHETHDIHCYSKLTAGLSFHRELMADPATTRAAPATMSQFRQLLRRTYSLDRNNAAAVRTLRGGAKKPRLMIVARKRTRILTNVAEISLLARKLGFEVVTAEGGVSTNLTEFAQLVNSCDVMMGIHGAGLTNMVFLPEKAVLIQVVPLGAIDVFAKLDFGDPCAGMKIRYLEYKIELKESSLLQRYPVDHAVIKDPLSVHRQGWAKLREIYLHNQNVTIDVARFRPTLAKALKLLRP